MLRHGVSMRSLGKRPGIYLPLGTVPKGLKYQSEGKIPGGEVRVGASSHRLHNRDISTAVWGFIETA